MNPYRSQIMRDLAQDSPHCFLCKKPNDGTVVGCHSNAISDGHGVSHKSHDLLAFLCDKCHKYIDEHWKEPRVQEDFYHCVYDTTIWLLQGGYLTVKRMPKKWQE